jgi:hypothetical protein
MRSYRLILLLVPVLFGLGCIKPPQPKLAPRLMPTLNIDKPGLTTSTTNPEIGLIGSTNMPEVYVGQERYDVEDGEFDIILKLKEGKNRIQVSAGNGQTTSTMWLAIQKLESAEEK